MYFLDWIVLAGFLVILIAVVSWTLRRKEESISDYFLGGRNASWLVIGASIFVSNIGSEHLMGLAGSGAESGMAMAHWEMHSWMILLLGWVFVPIYARSGVLTMPEFLERRYNAKARSLLSLISVISYILTKVAVTVYAGGIIFKDLFGIDAILLGGGIKIDFFWVSAIGLVVITGLYTTFGGMKAVLLTALIQAPVLLFGSAAIIVIGLIKLGDISEGMSGWSKLMEITRSTSVNASGDSMATLMRSHSDPDFPWTGVLLGSAIIGLWYWCTDQYIVQRTLSAQNINQARKGTILGAYLKLTPVFLFLIPGMIAHALHQEGFLELQNNDAAFSTLVTELLPIGFKGLVIGSILSALMSSLASLFNTSAMLFTVDFYKKYKPEASEKENVFVGKIATVIFVVIGILWIPVMKGFGKVLYEYLQDIQSMLAPGIAAVFLLGILTKKITPTAGFIGLLSGFSIGITRLVFQLFAFNIPKSNIIYQFFVETNWLHYEIIVFVITIIIMIVVSFFTQRASENTLKDLTIRSFSAGKSALSTPSYSKWDITHSVIIMGLVIAFYIYFW